MQDAVIGHMQKSITKQSLNYAIFQNKNLILMIKIKQFLLQIEPPKPQKVGPYFLYNVTFTDNISYGSKISNEVYRCRMAVFL